MATKPELVRDRDVDNILEGIRIQWMYLMRDNLREWTDLPRNHKDYLSTQDLRDITGIGSTTINTCLSDKTTPDKLRTPQLDTIIRLCLAIKEDPIEAFSRLLSQHPKLKTDKTDKEQDIEAFLRVIRDEDMLSKVKLSSDEAKSILLKASTLFDKMNK